MAVRARALGQCLVLLVTCVSQVSGQSSDAGDYPHHNDTCELLESTFVKDKCVAQFQQLQENGCREYCGSVEGQECRPDYIPCEEKSGLCDSGHKCCSNDRPCPTGEKSRRGGRYSEFLAECTRNKCDQEGDYPKLESRYVCPDAEDVYIAASEIRMGNVKEFEMCAL